MKPREIAIYLSGLITGDFLVGLWLYAVGDLPMNFLGMRLTPGVAVYWMGLDVVIFFGLIYYAFFQKKKSR